ncbi:MAG: hypothetical protein ACYC9S_12965, partial [Leptospirales bacterium]
VLSRDFMSIEGAHNLSSFLEQGLSDPKKIRKRGLMSRAALLQETRKMRFEEPFNSGRKRK